MLNYLQYKLSYNFGNKAFSLELWKEPWSKLNLEGCDLENEREFSKGIIQKVVEK